MAFTSNHAAHPKEAPSATGAAPFGRHVGASASASGSGSHTSGGSGGGRDASASTLGAARRSGPTPSASSTTVSHQAHESEPPRRAAGTSIPSPSRADTQPSSSSSHSMASAQHASSADTPHATTPPMNGVGSSESGMHRTAAQAEHPTTSLSAESHAASRRPASKTRRMSPGGSRTASEEPNAQRFAEASSLEDGHEWQHRRAPRAGVSTSSAAATSTTSTGSRLGESSQRSRPRRDVHASSPASNEFEQARPHLDLATFPPQDLLRVLAALLHQIATANDQLRPVAVGSHGATASAGPASGGGASGGSGSDRQRWDRDPNAPPEMALPNGGSGGGGGNSLTSSTDSLMGGVDADGTPRRRQRPTTAAMSALQAPSSTLCFHARNVPSITIEAYLLRILKYCPTTNEVFLSLLVYFDRMSRMGHRAESAPGEGQRRGAAEEEAADPSAASARAPSTVAGDDGAHRTSESSASPWSSSASQAPSQLSDGMPPDGEPHVGIRGFAIDSYNVHRLVIAGITVASKFFSDVFYTNSRYAKVCRRRGGRGPLRALARMDGMADYFSFSSSLRVHRSEDCRCTS